MHVKQTCSFSIGTPRNEAFFPANIILDYLLSVSKVENIPSRELLLCRLSSEQRSQIPPLSVVMEKEQSAMPELQS